jgi:hypothetical protein
LRASLSGDLNQDFGSISAQSAVSVRFTNAWNKGAVQYDLKLLRRFQRERIPVVWAFPRIAGGTTHTTQVISLLEIY